MEIITVIIVILILLFSVAFHEVSHGLAAYALGDPTAKYAGRLTLNPLKHLDPFGSIILPGILILINLATGGGGIIFGLAKPVPINPFNFRDKKYGSAKVAIAGPLANIALALVFGLTLRFFPLILAYEGMFILFLYIIRINLILAIFNLLPIPPLDGSHILFSFLFQLKNKAYFQNLHLILSQYGIFIVLFVIFFFFNYLNKIVISLIGLITGIS
jgi:Zn-dependent protease